MRRGQSVFYLCRLCKHYNKLREKRCKVQNVSERNEGGKGGKNVKEGERARNRKSWCRQTDWGGVEWKKRMMMRLEDRRQSNRGEGRRGIMRGDGKTKVGFRRRQKIKGRLKMKAEGRGN